ncbi:MAG: YciI family protein [Myxococcota bacterium]
MTGRDSVALSDQIEDEAGAFAGKNFDRGQNLRCSRDYETTMQFILQILETESAFDQRAGAESDTYWGAWRAYTDALVQAGVLVSGNVLDGPATATTVRVRDGQTDVHDGPFAETREQFGGYYVIEVDDLDVALQWAARAPCDGSVEVRPILGGS